MDRTAFSLLWRKFRYLLAIRLYSQYAKESAQNESDISQKGGQEPRIFIAGKYTLGSSFLNAQNCSEGGDGQRQKRSGEDALIHGNMDGLVLFSGQRWNQRRQSLQQYSEHATARALNAQKHLRMICKAHISHPFFGWGIWAFLRLLLLKLDSQKKKI